MKSARLQERPGKKNDKGYIIQPDKADTGDKFFIVQQQDLAFHLLYLLFDRHINDFKCLGVVYIIVSPGGINVTTED